MSSDNKVENKITSPFQGSSSIKRGLPKVKVKDFKKTMKRLLRYFIHFKFSLIFIVFLAIIGTIFNVVSPRILGLAITKISDGAILKLKGVAGAHIDFNYVFKILIVLGVLYILSSAFLFAQRYFMVSITQKTIYNIRKDVEEKLNRLPLKYFDTHTKGDILSRLTNDLENIGSTIQQALNQLLTALIIVIGVIIMMFSMNIYLTLVCVIILPFGIFGVKPMVKKAQKHFSSQRSELGQMNGHIEEVYSGHQIIKIFSREEEALKKFDKINEKLYISGWKSQFISGILMPIMRAISNFTYVVVAVLGGIFVSNGYITIGELQAFIKYVSQLTEPISQVANIMNVLQSTVASAQRVFEILDEQEEE